MKFLSLLGQAPDDYYADPNMYNTQMYDTMANPQVSDAAVAATLVGVLIFVLIATVIAYAVSSFLLSRIFKKAGVEQWKAWVPVYNTWVMLELGDQKGFWAILMLIPPISIVATVFIIIAMYNIGLKLGKDGAFVLLAIFLPLVWMIWLAFDKSVWKGTLPAKAVAAPAVGTPTPPTPPAPEPTPPKKDDSPSKPPAAPSSKV